MIKWGWVGQVGLVCGFAGDPSNYLVTLEWAEMLQQEQVFCQDSESANYLFLPAIPYFIQFPTKHLTLYIKTNNLIINPTNLTPILLKTLSPDL